MRKKRVRECTSGKGNHWINQVNEVDSERRSLWLRDDSIKRETVSFVFAE